jgi:hypothetical protein
MHTRRLFVASCAAVVLGVFHGTASAAFPSGIVCPSGTKPAGGWPLVFIWNGNCFKAVGTGGLAADVQNELISQRLACAAQIANSDIVHAADIDTMIRTKVVPLISKNTAFINVQKIGAAGFSAGGAIAAYFGTKWSQGIDPVTGTNNGFHVGGVLNLYGPLRMDRSPATDGLGNLTGGGGLFYLHENREHDLTVDIPNARQWDNPNCFCAARGTSQCQCDAASSKYMTAYLTAYDPNPSNRVCSFYSDDANLVNMSVTDYIQQVRPAHVAPMYLCNGWKDSNVDYDYNVNQARAWWRPESSMVVTADDGHGFPLSVCEASADAEAVTRPIQWLVSKLNTVADSPPIYR